MLAPWPLPPSIKFLEALGAIADDRVEITETGARVTSSSGNKTYDVTIDERTRVIYSNDNASYFVGYLGYPAVAALMKRGLLPYDRGVAELLKEVPWKDINTRTKNNYTKTEQVIRETRGLSEEDWSRLQGEAGRIEIRLAAYKALKDASHRAKPPAGY